MELDFCDDATIKSSWFNVNGVGTNDHSGVSLDDSTNASIYSNDFYDNAKSGLRMTSNSDGGDVYDNRGSGNGDNDAYQSGNSSNTWNDNDFDNPSPSWLD